MATSTDLRIKITAQDQASPALNKTRQGVQSISDQLDSLRTQAIAAFGAFELANRAVRLAQLADQIQGVNSRLLIAVGSQEAFTVAQERAYQISAQTGAGYEATAKLLSRLSQVGAGYGLTQEQIATTTEVTARALQLSGAAAAETSSVITQLSQALGSGVLRGEEFNAIMENGPRLAQALADGLGLPVGKLRALAEQGLLTTEVVTKALESQRGVLEAEADGYQRTMGQAASAVSDEFGRMVNAANQWTGAGRGVAATFDYVAGHMREMLSGVAVLAVSGLTVALVRGGQAAAAWAVQTVAAQNAAVASAIALRQATVAEAEAELQAALARRASLASLGQAAAAEQAVTVARANLTTATTSLNAAQAQSNIVVRGLTGVLGLLGGPIGVITTLLTAGATAWMIWGDRAESAGSRAKTAAEDAEAALKRMRNAQAFGEDALRPFRADVAAAEEALEDAKRKWAEAEAAMGAARNSGDFKAVLQIRYRLANQTDITDAEARLDKANARLAEASRMNRAKIESGGGAAASSLNVMGQSFDRWLDSYRSKIDPLGAALKDLVDKAKEAKIPVDSPEYKNAEALVRKSFEKKGSSAGQALDLDGYGKQALSAMQAESSRKMGLLKAGLDAEMSVARRGYESGVISLEDYYAERRRIIEVESQAEIDQQRAIVTQAQAEIERLNQLKPAGKRGAEQISDQTRDLNEKIKDAENKIEVLKTKAATVVADLDAEAVKAARERVATKMADAQAIVTATEQSLQSRVVTGLETEATARAKLKTAIREQGQALERDLVPQIERMMLVAESPKARAELQAMLDKIREMAAEGKTQTWVDGMKQGVRDYATTAADAFATAKDAATRAFRSMEDALVQFATTGKFSVADMVNSMLADFARLAIRQSITAPLASGLESLLSQWSMSGLSGGFGGGLGGTLATGGRVTGPGTGTSDSIPTMLSNGEYVIREAAARKLGYDRLDQLNQTGELPERHAGGGVVGRKLADIAGKGGSTSVRLIQTDRVVDRSTLERILPPLHDYVNTVQDRPTPFSAPSLQPFARGGVFAEAGPEAVMPLARTRDGRLGVTSTGSQQPASVSVEIHNHSGQPVQQQETTDGRGGRRVRVIIGEQVAGEVVRPGSAMHKSISAAYGLRPALVTR